jgi:tetratricopeptide (TPR) repeat protein
MLYLERRPLRHASNPSRIEKSANRVWRHRRSAALVALAAALPLFVFAVISDSQRPSEATLQEVRQALDQEKAGQIEAASVTLKKVAPKNDAIAAIRQILRQNDGSILLHLGLGEAAIQATPADLDLARSSFLDVYRLRPADRWALNGLARIAGLRKDHKEAVRWLTAVIEQTKNAPLRTRTSMPTHLIARARELNEMGDVALEAHEFVDADTYFAQSLADLDWLDREDIRKLLKPENEASILFSRSFYASVASFGRGKAAEGDGHPREALAFFDAARGLVPEAERWANAIGNEVTRRGCLDGIALLREKIPGAIVEAAR